MRVVNAHTNATIADFGIPTSTPEWLKERVQLFLDEKFPSLKFKVKINISNRIASFEIVQHERNLHLLVVQQ